MHAYEFLYEGICGKGLKKLLTQWGGITQVINFSGEGQGQAFSLTFIFDKEKLNQKDSEFHFTA